MAKRKRDWERESDKLAGALKELYCKHWEGNYCEICGAKKIASLARRAEKEGFNKGFNEGAEFMRKRLESAAVHAVEENLRLGKVDEKSVQLLAQE